MSANIYTIADLLVGTTYKSKTLLGTIVRAEEDDRAVWYGEDTKPYRVEITPASGSANVWRTLAVQTN